MSKIACRKEGCDIVDDSKLHLHHILPKFMGGTDKDGRKRLCKKHHDKLHGILPKKIWEFVPEDRKEECKKAIVKYSLWWLSINENKTR